MSQLRKQHSMITFFYQEHNRPYIFLLLLPVRFIFTITYTAANFLYFSLAYIGLQFTNRPNSIFDYQFLFMLFYVFSCNKIIDNDK